MSAMSENFSTGHSARPTTLHDKHDNEKIANSFKKYFLSRKQLEKIMIYYSHPASPGKQCDLLTDVVVLFLTHPLHVTFTFHGVHFFTNQTLPCYPIENFDNLQKAYLLKILQKRFTHNFVKNADLEIHDEDFPEVPLYVNRQMGGGAVVNSQFLRTVHVDQLDILVALTHGFLLGPGEHCVAYRKHALSVQLQRLYSKVNLSRNLIHEIAHLVDSIE